MPKQSAHKKRMLRISKAWALNSITLQEFYSLSRNYTDIRGNKMGTHYQFECAPEQLATLYPGRKTDLEVDKLLGLDGPC